MDLLSAGDVVRRFLASSAGRYLLVGGASFVLDLGLLALCYRVFGWPLWLATAAGFWGSFFFNFSLQRRFAFRTDTTVLGGAFRYSLLLGVNTLATIGIVWVFEEIGAGIVIGKVVATGATTVWNYFLYKYWVFPRVLPRVPQAPPGASEQGATGRPTPREG